MSASNDADLVRRFSGVSRLYGAAGLAQLQAMHICVIGIGGVGSWAAEALARNAVGRITLIDLDNIAESNVNRQLHAVDGAFGQAKVQAMAARIMQINPIAHVTQIEDFITPENIAALLNGSFEPKFDGIVDCIDDAKAKIAIAAFCKAQQIPLVMTGAAGGRLDPTRIRTADLSVVTHDKLLAKVRNGLRRDHGFAKGRDGIKQKQPSMHIPCVYSDELVIAPNSSNEQVCEVDADATTETSKPITGLNCAGYGSSVCVTAPFGFAAVAYLLQLILNNY